MLNQDRQWALSLFNEAKLLSLMLKVNDLPIHTSFYPRILEGVTKWQEKICFVGRSKYFVARLFFGDQKNIIPSGAEHSVVRTGR